jgi:hypothetical protein
MKYRVVKTNDGKIYIQRRVLFLFWVNLKEPLFREDGRYFGGDIKTITSRGNGVVPYDDVETAVGIAKALSQMKYNSYHGHKIILGWLMSYDFVERKLKYDEVFVMDNEDWRGKHPQSTREFGFTLEELYKKIDEYDESHKTVKQKENDGKKISEVYNLK